MTERDSARSKESKNATIGIPNGTKTKTSVSLSMYSQINIEEELERFVSQIEENTYSILSIKQKFNLIQSGESNFEKDSTEKMDKFTELIQELDQHVNSAFSNYNHRLDNMELLAFRPNLYHPSKIITINESYQITAALYTSENVLVGTDSSRVLVYDSHTLQFVCEIGPLTPTPPVSAVIQIGTTTANYNHLIVAATANKVLHIFDLKKPQQRISMNYESFATWTTNLTSLYRLALSIDGFIHLYKEETFSQFEVLKCDTEILSPANEGLLCVNKDEVILFLLDPFVAESSHYQIPFLVTSIAASREFFVVSGNCNEIAVVTFDSSMDMRIVNVGGVPRFLFSWGSYFFQMGDDTLVECYDYEGKKEKAIIGDKAWWPHEIQSPLAACGISESTLVTAQDLTCVLWN